MGKKCIVIFLTEDTAHTYDGKPLMLQEVLFCPVLNWCLRSWMEKGIRQFFVVCDSEYHDEVTACFPAGAIAAVSTEDRYREELAQFAAGCWIDEVHEAIMPVGSMMLTFQTVEELVRLRRAVQEDIVAYHQKTRVRVIDPDHTYINPRVTIGSGTTILPGTILRGHTVIGDNCEIGPNALIEDTVVGDGCVVNASQVYNSTLAEDVHVGPFAHVRPNCQIGKGCKVGAFVEIKNCVLNQGTKISHLTYVGDADVGSNVNFGCGTVTSNYDGFAKHRTTIGNNVFIGCNTNLIPPVTVADGAYIAAGTTVTKDVEADALAIGRVRQENKAGWAEKNRRLHKK